MDIDKTIIITGGNSGLGYECAKNIAASGGFFVVLACRNVEKAEAAKSELTSATGNSNIAAMQLDVSSLASVRAFAAYYKTTDFPPLYGLVCNAGINGMNTGLTPDGFDVVFETNHLGHFLLANLLLPEMRPDGRIAVVSSDMHDPPGGLSSWPGVGALAHPGEPLASDSVRYSYSKLCNLYFMYGLAKRLARVNSGITVNAFNPGLMTDTNFAPNKSRFSEEFLEKVADRLGSLEKSAAALAEIVTSPDCARISGQYFDRSTDAIPSSPLSYGERNRLELWDGSVIYTKLKESETLPGLLAGA